MEKTTPTMPVNNKAVVANTLLSDRPIRVQRKRSKGWRMPPNTVYVGRPSFWGNPHSWTHLVELFARLPEYQTASKTRIETAAKNHAKDQFLRDIEQGHHNDYISDNFEPDGHCFDDFKDEVKSRLRGKNLACWCTLDSPCHADVLLEIANS